jgi:hypothetical protein
LIRRLRKFVRLPAEERSLSVKAALLLTAAKASLVLLPFKTVRRVFGKAGETPLGARFVDRSSVEKVVWAVGSAGRLLPWARTCLTEALAAQVLLSRRGHQATLRIGVVKGEGEQFLAHAWVESGGAAVIGGRELERYVPLLTIDGKLDGK